MLIKKKLLFKTSNNIKHTLLFNTKFKHSASSTDCNTIDDQKIGTSDKPERFFSLYKRNAMPTNTLFFSHSQSQNLLVESIQTGYSSSFFPLIEQLHTQSDPSYCGPSTMNIILNSLMIDPRKKWKG